MALFECKKTGGLKFPEIETTALDNNINSFSINTNENEVLIFTANVYNAVTLNSGGTVMASGYGNRMVAIKPTSNVVNVTINGGNSKNLIRIKKDYQNANAYMNTSGSSLSIANESKDSLAIAWQGNTANYPNAIKNFPCLLIQNAYAICYAIEDTNNLTMSSNTNISIIVLS